MESEERLYKREFWIEENLKYSRPHLRLRKAARIINRMSRGVEFSILDVGCGSATISRLLDENIKYFGIDIAIHEPSPNLIEIDILEEPISFNGLQFDAVLAQGVFEYLGRHQDRKFSEIAKILKPGGKFVVSYVNFGHRDRRIYWPYSNVMLPEDFRDGLARYFEIKRVVPTSHHWVGRPPRDKLFESIQRAMNMELPWVSKRLAVEYLFICIRR